MKTESIIDKAIARGTSKKFLQFCNGVTVDYPTGERALLKIESITAKPIPAWLRVGKFAYQSVISGGGFHEVGFGEAEYKLIAIQKSIAEATERISYRILKGSHWGTANSNGWAAHIFPERAKQKALFELLERDSALVHWLCKRPMREITQPSWPEELQNWVHDRIGKTPIQRVRILLSDAGHIPTISSLLVDTNGNSVVSHCAGNNLQSAVIKALSETCGLARIALRKRYLYSSQFLNQRNITSKLGPADHGVYYAHHVKLPEWIFGEQISWIEARREWVQRLQEFSWKSFPHSFVKVMDGPLTVGWCKCEEIQNLYFGSTEAAVENGLVNKNRIKKMLNNNAINLLPHFVA